MILLRDNYFAVQVPEGAHCIELEIDKDEDWYMLTYFENNDDEESGFYGEPVQYDIEILPGQWQIVCTSKECTEGEASQIVEGVDSEGRGMIYINYNNGMYVFKNPSSSLRTLLTSSGCDITNNYIILKKIA